MIEHPAEPTYWIISSEHRTLAGVTLPDQVTSAGPQWTLLLQTTDEAEWLAECERLGIRRDE
jgi:hypothetical protein